MALENNVSIVGFSVRRKSFPLFGCAKVGDINITGGERERDKEPGNFPSSLLPAPLHPMFCSHSKFRAEDPKETLATQCIIRVLSDNASV